MRNQEVMSSVGEFRIVDNCEEDEQTNKKNKEILDNLKGANKAIYKRISTDFPI